MRFVFSICASFSLLTLSGAVFAQTIDLSTPTDRTVTPRLQKSKQVERLKTAQGFILEKVENGLGTISALTTNHQDLIYTADPNTGRIWSLTDRDKDGRIDIKRALPYLFDKPTGLAASGDFLYVADRAAIWVIEGTQPPRRLAGLKNAKSTAAYHPLTLSPDGSVLFLGLTTPENVTKILSIDRQSGEANLIESQDGTTQLRDISALSNEHVWILSEDRMGASLSQSRQVHEDYRLTSMALLQSVKNWPVEFTQSVVLSQHSADGFSVIALPASLGILSLEGETLLSGFMSDSGRTAWGSPGPIIFDGFGLLIADSFNGDIYRLSAAHLKSSEPASSPTARKGTQDTPQTSKTPPSMVVSTITGSQINKASSIDAATTLETGSTILRDYKALETEQKDEAQSDETDTNTTPN